MPARPAGQRGPIISRLTQLTPLAMAARSACSCRPGLGGRRSDLVTAIMITSLANGFLIGVRWGGPSGGFNLLWTAITARIAAGVIVALWYNTLAVLALGLLFARLLGIGRLFTWLNSEESFHRHLYHDAAPP